jgi:Lipocalin-like domain
MKFMPFVLSMVIATSGAIAQSDKSNSAVAQIVGAWNLVSWDLRMEDGSTAPHCWDLGSLIYSDSGRMCWVGMASNRSRWPEGTDPSDEQVVEAFQGVASYCARVEVHSEEGFVLHHVDLGQYPNDPGIIRKRWFSFEGPDRLILTVDPAELTPPLVESKLIWERVPD